MPGGGGQKLVPQLDSKLVHGLVTQIDYLQSVDVGWGGTKGRFKQC